MPAPVGGGTPPVAPVGAGNTAWDPGAERLVPRFAFPAQADGPVLPPRPKTAALEILREHWKRGRAAGNHGDLYDNRDRGHSTLAPDAFPQLAHVVYDAAARAADLDYGLADRLLFPAPTLGNSSTAITAGALWRSLPRAAMTAPDGTGPLRLWQNAGREPARPSIRRTATSPRRTATCSRPTPPTCWSAAAPRAPTSRSSRRPR